VAEVVVVVLLVVVVVVVVVVIIVCCCCCHAMSACLLCVQLNVKLFVFDNKTQSWLERGLGLLRLNDRCLPSDSDSFQSRLGQFTIRLCLSVC